MSKKYVVYCETEAAYVEGWASAEPTTCFHDDSHVITTAKTKELSTPYFRLVQSGVTDSTVQVPKLYIQHTHVEVKNFETKDIVLPVEVDQNVFSIQLEFSDASMGDVFSIWLNKDTTIGGFTQTTTSSVLPVSDSVLLYAKPGFFLGAGAGVHHRITNVDSEAKTVTLNGPLSVTSGSACQLTYFLIYEWVITRKNYTFGTSIIGSSSVAKGNVSGITYNNRSDAEKGVTVAVETTF